jgi:hypothetical protein
MRRQMMAEGIKPQIVGTGHVVVAAAHLSGTARTQTRFSVQHLLAAAHFSRQVAQIEGTNAGKGFGGFFEEILTNATACVFTCAASLEAYANEFYIDRGVNFPDLRAEVADRLWELFEQKPILEKFDLALLLKNRPALDRGTRPTQDVNAVVSLRNALTHFKPEWEDEKETHAKVSRQLQGRFAPSQFLPNESTVFPRQWACHGCTSWAVSSCLGYIRAFETAAGLAPKFDKFASRLAP